jgi:transposase
LPTARELGEQLYQLAQREADPMHRLEAHGALGGILFYLGDYAAARTYLEQGLTLIDPTAQWALALRANVTTGVTWCLVHEALTLWCLGYPAQALQRSQEALALAQELAHPYSLGLARHYAASLHHHRRETMAVQAQAEALLTLATSHGFPLWAGFGTCWRGWALALQGQVAACLGAIYHDAQFAALFPTRGQPAASPARLALATVLQCAEGLSDRQAADAVRSRIDGKYVLGLALPAPGFDHTVLSAFRTCLITGKAEQLLLDALLTLARAQGLRKARGRQRTDSTHMFAALHVLNRLERVGETLRAALNSLAVVAPTWVQALARRSGMTAMPIGSKTTSCARPTPPVRRWQRSVGRMARCSCKRLTRPVRHPGCGRSPRSRPSDAYGPNNTPLLRAR